MMHCQIAVATASISLLDRACLGPKSWTSEERLFSITFQLKATGTRLTGPDDPPCQFINCLATIFNSGSSSELARSPPDLAETNLPLKVNAAFSGASAT